MVLCLFIKYYLKNIFLLPISPSAISKINLRRKFTAANSKGDFDLVIVGGGVSGLGTAAIMSRLNYKVLVLEQNEVVGGGLHTFKTNNKDNVKFEAGLHYIGNDQKALDLIEFIANTKINFKTIQGVYDQGIFPNFTINLRPGSEAWKKEFYSKFPNDIEDIENFFDHLMIVKCFETRLFFALKVLPIPNRCIFMLQRILCRRFFYLADKTITETFDMLNITNYDLRAAFCLQAGDHGELPSKGSFFLHACVMMHYIDGAVLLDAEKLVTSFCKQIESKGGKILAQAKVTGTNITENKCVSVIVNDDVEIKIPNKIVWSIPQKPRQNQGYQLFSIFLKMKPGHHIITMNKWVFLTTDFDTHDKELNCSKDGTDIDERALFISSATDKINQTNKDESTLTILSTCKKHWYEKFINLTKAERKKNSAYIEWKKKIQQSIFLQIDKLYPRLLDFVYEINTASPLSTKDYLGFTEFYGMKLQTSK